MVVPLDIVAEHARWSDRSSSHTGRVVVADPGPGGFSDEFERTTLQGPINCKNIDVSGPDRSRRGFVLPMVTGPCDLNSQHRAEGDTTDDGLAVIPVP